MLGASRSESEHVGGESRLMHAGRVASGKQRRVGLLNPAGVASCTRSEFGCRKRPRRGVTHGGKAG
jgi:hypothetical protein